EMVADAAASDRMIGMVLLRPGWERDYEGRPPIYPIGCSGVMTHVERLPDGRYNIVLRGLERFRILEEDHERSYRRAVVEPLHETALSRDDRDVVRSHRTRLETMLAPAIIGGDAKIPSAMSDEDLVNALAQYLDLEPLEKQALLEQPCLPRPTCLTRPTCPTCLTRPTCPTRLTCPARPARPALHCSRSKRGGPATTPLRCASASRTRSATMSGCAAATSRRSPGSSAR